MGCTSSAPNMATSQTNSEKDLKQSAELDENSMEDTDEVIHKEKNEANGIKVLPPCDTLVEPSQVARNKCLKDTSLDLGKDCRAKAGHVKEGDIHIVHHKTVEITENLEAEEKISTLEEAVEKVVGLQKDNAIENLLNEAPIVENTHSNKDEDNNDEKIAETEPGEQKEEEPCAEEAPSAGASPSRSERSRATRWEALADIAAELPPSLAVDPVTGQIYALSK